MVIEKIRKISAGGGVQNGIFGIIVGVSTILYALVHIADWSTLKLVIVLVLSAIWTWISLLITKYDWKRLQK